MPTRVCSRRPLVRENRAVSSRSTVRSLLAAVRMQLTGLRTYVNPPSGGIARGPGPGDGAGPESFRTASRASVSGGHSTPSPSTRSTCQTRPKTERPEPRTLAPAPKPVGKLRSAMGYGFELAGLRARFASARRTLLPETAR